MLPIHTDNIALADAEATSGAKASTDMVLKPESRTILSPAQKNLNSIYLW